MATETKTTQPKTAQPKNEEMVDIFIEKGYANDEPNLLVSVNGKNYLLPRGKSSKVPKAIAREIERSRKAQAALDEKIDAMLEDMEKKAKELK